MQGGWDTTNKLNVIHFVIQEAANADTSPAVWVFQ